MIFESSARFKVPMSWLGNLHIYNIWNRGTYILSFENFIFVDFLAVKVNGSRVKPGICVTVNTRCYRHTENISLDFEPNRYYLMKINRYSQIHGSFVYSNTVELRGRFLV